MALIIDMIYEKRVNHVAELAKMAGKISTSANHVAYEGPNQFQGQSSKQLDLRAGAALVIAGLLAHGKTGDYKRRIYFGVAIQILLKS